MGPCNKVHIAKLESVQRRAARFCYNDYRRTSSVTSMLPELGFKDLQSRRDQSKLTMMHMIVNNSIEIPVGQYLNATDVAAREHHQRFQPIYCSINAYKGSAFPSTVRLWNGLPASVISAPTLKDLKLLVGADILRP